MTIQQELEASLKLGTAFVRQSGVVVRELTTIVCEATLTRVAAFTPIASAAIRRSIVYARQRVISSEPTLVRSAHWLQTAFVDCSRRSVPMLRTMLAFGGMTARTWCDRLTDRASVLITSRTAKVSAAVVAVAVVTGLSWSGLSDRDESSTGMTAVEPSSVDNIPVSPDEVQAPMPERHPFGLEQIANDAERVDAGDAVVADNLDDSNMMPAEDNFEQQQAQAEFNQAAADLDAAVQMWNAEVAACEAASHATYSSRQMGMFAAMGVTPAVQPQRQPNEMLYQAAAQAEQRFLQAQSNLSRFQE